jgi:hypothetical protein
VRDEQSQRRISKYRYLIGIDEGLSYSDYGDEDTPYDVKPTNAVQPMQELASLLNETHLKDLYHATQNDVLIKILETDTIKLAFTGGTKQTMILIKENISFFLPCAVSMETMLEAAPLLRKCPITM